MRLDVATVTNDIGTVFQMRSNTMDIEDLMARLQLLLDTGQAQPRDRVLFRSESKQDDAYHDIINITGDSRGWLLRGPVTA